MVRDDKERVIGKLISINSEKFTVELLSKSINFSINGFDDIYQYAQINGYVILPYQDYYIVAEIFGVREKDADSNWKGEHDHVLSKANSVKYLDVNPIGTIQREPKNKKHKFKYGVSVFPTLYSDVLYIKKEELDIIFERSNETRDLDHSGEKGTGLNLLEIGTSSIFPDYKVKVDINGFFGHHSAVLGNTGSGKSCTITALLQTLFKKSGFSATGASFIFFDVNGEYFRAFCGLANEEIELRYFSVDEPKSKADFEEIYCDDELKEITASVSYHKFSLPHWFLNLNEWELLLQASEKTQIPILRTALGFSQGMTEETRQHIYASNIKFVFENWDSPVAKRQRITALVRSGGFSDIDIKGYDAKYGNFKDHEAEQGFKESVEKYIKPEDFVSPVYRNEPFEFDKLADFIDDAILYEEYHGNNQIRDYCASLITRFKSIKDRKEFNFLTTATANVSKDKFIESLIGGSNAQSKKTQVTIIDLNSVEDEIVEVISCIVSRLLFERLKNATVRNVFPINLILEEAHRYISDSNRKVLGEANKIFERVAKEGRKYGLFLLLSSQRPSELSRTVLSQCSNYIVHRIQNPEDLSQIRQMTPHVSASILNRLTSIPRQHALIFGHSVEIPTLFKVNDASPTPHSHDNDVVKNWFRPKYKPELKEPGNDFPDGGEDGSGPGLVPPVPSTPPVLSSLPIDENKNEVAPNHIVGKWDDDLPF